MIKIAVFSNKKNSIRLKKYIKSSAAHSNVKAEVTIYLNYYSLCSAVENECVYNMIFFDIDIMPHKILQIALHIRNVLLDKQTEFVFISRRKKYIHKFLKLQPLDYFLKPLNRNETDMIIRKYILENKLCYNSFIYKKNNIECRMPVSRIIYLHEFRGCVVLHTNECQIELEGCLAEYLLEDCLNNFIAIGKNVFVNPTYIEQIARDFLVVSEDVRLPIKQIHVNNVNVNDNINI